MKRILIIISALLFLASCKTKKVVVAPKPKQPKKEVVVQAPKEEQNPIEENQTEVVVVKEIPKSEGASVVDRYINKYSLTAIKEMHKYKIPASITLAQGILESQSGNSRLATLANNHFGIKCHRGWKGQSIKHDDDKKQECFRKYQNEIQSYRDHSLFLRNRKRYSKLFILDISDYVGWANGLREAGYATDKKYPQKLINLIEKYQLYNYDYVMPQDLPQEEIKENTTITTTPPKSYGNYYEVKQGDTLYSIARNNNTTVKKIKEINGLTNNNIKIGQHLLLN